MTTIYIPRLIETAEQAEALPRLSFWFDPEEAEDGGWVQPWIKGGSVWFGDDEGDLRAHHLVGQVVFVPIEAEEETTSALGWYGRTVHESSKHTRPVPSRRLVTPWRAQD